MASKDCEWMVGEACGLTRLGPSTWSGSTSFEKAISDIRQLQVESERPIMLRIPSGITAKQEAFTTCQAAIEALTRHVATATVTSYTLRDGAVATEGPPRGSRSLNRRDTSELPGFMSFTGDEPGATPIADGSFRVGLLVRFQSHGGRKMMKWTRTARILMIGQWLVAVAFMWSLPFLSYVFNEGAFGFEPMWKSMCVTPANELFCGDGQNYTQLAIKWNRTRHGEYIGCSCGQGAFGDFACPVGFSEAEEPHGFPFSISYFIATPTGTGAMAAFTGMPIMAMWLYGAAVPEMFDMVRHGSVVSRGGSVRYHRILFWTLVAFQLTYGLFLINPVCANPIWHSGSVGLFNLSMVTHYCAVAWNIGYNNAASRTIVAMLLVAVVGIGFGFTYSSYYTHDRWVFFISECTGLTMGFGIAPVMAAFSACTHEEAVVESEERLSQLAP